MALTPEEKTQKQIDAAVKAAVKRERATVKSVITGLQDVAKTEGNKAATQSLKSISAQLKEAYAASDAPIHG